MPSDKSKTLLLSIVVPIYNVEAYLKECLDSLICEQAGQYEVILVDDCGSDNSMKIAKSYSGLHPHLFKIITHETNQGLSEARNSGIEVASAEYVMFVDSDDYLADGFIDKLLIELKKKNLTFEMLFFDHIKFSENGQKDFVSLDKKFKNSFLIPNELHKSLVMEAPVVAWSKVFDKKLFTSVRFCKGLTNEDLALIPAIIESSTKMAYFPEPGYFYRERPGSLSGEITKSPELLLTALNELFRHSSRSAEIEFIAIRESLVYLPRALRPNYSNMEKQLLNSVVFLDSNFHNWRNNHYAFKGNLKRRLFSTLVKCVKLKIARFLLIKIISR